mmetsp:Transcript_21499/g.54923  ORF Transcript_21499/g.54923 Transcript_21499/m.54923 type:complete len:110 (+) Transcript_21499:174-503(+)
MITMTPSWLLLMSSSHSSSAGALMVLVWLHHDSPYLLLAWRCSLAAVLIYGVLIIPRYCQVLKTEGHQLMRIFQHWWIVIVARFAVMASLALSIKLLVEFEPSCAVKPL